MKDVRTHGYSGSSSFPSTILEMLRDRAHQRPERNVQHIYRSFGGLGEQSIVAGWLPLYHDMGLIGNVLQPLYACVPCVLMSHLHFQERPARWLQAISRYRATTSGGPKLAYDLCARSVSIEQRSQLGHQRSAPETRCWPSRCCRASGVPFPPTCTFSRCSDPRPSRSWRRRLKRPARRCVSRFRRASGEPVNWPWGGMAGQAKETGLPQERGASERIGRRRPAPH
jgi:hypothetical protein